MNSLSDGGLYMCEVDCLGKKINSILNINPICKFENTFPFFRAFFCCLELTFFQVQTCFESLFPS